MSEYSDIINVLLLRDYNTRLVVVCTLLLGCACGLMGSFLLLRKRSLMGDTLSHATLPGVALAFILSVHLGGSGKSLPFLMVGAALTGVLGCWCVLLIRNHSRVKDDAAMGIVLSVFFGAGVALLGIVQNMPEGSAAGLESFIYGKTASMVETDFKVLMATTIGAILVSLVFYKEFKLLCFDEAFAASIGWPVKWLDILLLCLVATVTVAGLQAVGLILIIAFLITPAAAARFWTDQLSWMLPLSAVIGGLSGWIGASVSASFTDAPAGPVIVLVAASGFIFSLFSGAKRGILIRLYRQRQLKHSIGKQHLLRALFEILEADTLSDSDEVVIRPISFRQVLSRRTWSERELRRDVRRTYSNGLIEKQTEDDEIILTEAGLTAAMQMARNHRLWELYLIEYADVATSRVDRDADAVEHILGPEMVQRLEAKLQAHRLAETSGVPVSPHPIVSSD